MLLQQTYLHLSCHPVNLRRLQPHALGDAQRRRRAIPVTWQGAARHDRISVDEVHLHRGLVVLEREQSLPHDRIALQQRLQRVRLQGWWRRHHRDGHRHRHRHSTRWGGHLNAAPSANPLRPHYREHTTAALTRSPGLCRLSGTAMVCGGRLDGRRSSSGGLAATVSSISGSSRMGDLLRETTERSIEPSSDQRAATSSDSGSWCCCW
uniref:Uncharacterized protein n=1 Tax=Anopheles atroparvus TaxID=41427 RepID=A0A182JHG3_ANOAO